MTRDQHAAQIDGLIRDYEVLQADLASELRRQRDLDEAIESKHDDLSSLESRLSDLQSELAAAIEAESYDDWDDPYDDDDDDDDDD